MLSVSFFLKRQADNLNIQRTCHWQLLLHTLAYIKYATGSFYYILWYTKNPLSHTTKGFIRSKRINEFTQVRLSASQYHQ